MIAQAMESLLSHRYKRRWLRSFFIFWGLLGGIPVLAQVGFQIAPARLFFHQRNGLTQTAVVHVNNPSMERLVLQVTCADWRRDSTGTKTYAPPGTLATSCCSSLRVSPAVIELAPGEKKDIVVTFIGNAQLSMSQISNAMLLLTQSNEQELARLKPVAPQLIIRIQIGVHVYFLPKTDPPAAMDIADMAVIKPNDQYQVRIKIHNTGQALQESLLRLEYLNLQTMEEVKADPLPVNTMPQDKFWVTATLPPSLPMGKYLIVAILDSGTGTPLKIAELETVLK